MVLVSNVQELLMFVTRTDLLSVVDLRITSEASPILPDVAHPLTVEFKLACVRADSSCPGAPANANQYHYTFDLKVQPHNLEVDHVAKHSNPFSVEVCFLK